MFNGAPFTTDSSMETSVGGDALIDPEHTNRMFGVSGKVFSSYTVLPQSP